VEDLEAEAVDSESDFEGSTSSTASGVSTRTKSSLTTSKGGPKAPKTTTADQEKTRRMTLDTVAQLAGKKLRPSTTTIIRPARAATDPDNLPGSSTTAGALSRVIAAAATEQGNGGPPPGTATGAQEVHQTHHADNY
jgi:hypothetical protein